MASGFHPSLKKVFKASAEWMVDARAHRRAENFTARLDAALAAPGPLDSQASLHLGMLAHFHGMAACDALGRGDAPAIAACIRSAVALRALELRWEGMFAAMRPDVGNWPRAFGDSLRAAGPAMLGQWELSAVCATHFLSMAAQDARINADGPSRRLRHGTHDAFLLALFARAHGIEEGGVADVAPIPVYADLLAVATSDAQAPFAAAMHAAAEFHRARSRYSNGRTFYEFDTAFDQAFPAELLVVQALRRRDGHPDFATGHPLVDAAWALLRDLPAAAPDRYALAVEARLRQDYPMFR